MSKRKKRKRIRRAVKEAITLLRVLSEGQGHVGLSVFDAGAGGGFSHGELDVILERDGALCNVKAYTQKELIDSIMSMIDQRYDGMAIEHFWRKVTGDD